MLLSVGRTMRRCVECVCDTLMAAEEELNDLDRVSGDGDCGTTFNSGCTGT